MKADVAGILKSAGLVPVVPEMSRLSRDTESTYSCGVPAVPAVPGRNNESESETNARAIVAQALHRTGVDPDAVIAKLAAEDLHDIISGAMKPINIVALARSLRDQGEQSPARQRITALPLADKLRLSGKPWPLKVGGETVCWLVPDEVAAKACDKPEPVYTAAEAERLSAMPAEAVQAMHKLKARFGGTVTDYEKRRINEKRGCVTCASCRHFRRQDGHRHLGHCAAGVRPTAPAGLWDTDTRYCGKWLEISESAVSATAKTDKSPDEVTTHE